MFTLTFWRDVLSRSARSAVQVLAPTLILIGASGDVTGLHWLALADLAGVAFVVSFLKAFLGLQVDPSGSWWVQAAERALPAAVTSLLAYATATGFSLVTADYRAIGVAAAGAFLASLAHTFLDPARPRQDQVGLAA
jgi:hypothetical protein